MKEYKLKKQTTVVAGPITNSEFYRLVFSSDAIIKSTTPVEHGYMVTPFNNDLNQAYWVPKEEFEKLYEEVK
jgi:hypothetical protein